MSIGKKYTEGNKGSGLPFRSKVLQGIQAVTTATGLGATEATAQLILAAIQNGQDYESKIVEDATGATFIEVRIFQPDPPPGIWLPPVYYKAGDNTPYNIGDPGGPVAPLVYINPSSLLAQIYSELQAQSLTLTQIDLNTDNVATETTLASLLAAFNAEDFATEATSTLINSNIQLGNITLNSFLTAFNNEDFAQEVTQLAIAADIATIEANIASLNSKFNTLGRKDDTASAPVVLSNQDKLVLDNMLTVLQSIDADLGTGGLALETTQLANGVTLSSILAELQAALDVNVTNATLAVTQSGAWTVTANQGTTPWQVGGTVALDAGTLAALETITVLQGTTPWTVDGTVNSVQSGTWTVALDAATLAALETVTVNQGTSPWVVSAVDLDIRNLTFATDKVDASGSVIALDAATLLALETVQIGNAGLGNAVNIQDGGNSITIDNSNLDTALAPATRTHNTVSATGAGSVPAGSMCGSAINIGEVAGTWNGISLPAGVSIPWTQIGPRDTYGAIAYDATGTTFIIEYTS
jgi:hypothetical protein